MTEQAKVYLSDLHFEHLQWLSNLKFWDEELISFNKRLEEVVGRYTDIDKKAKVEHFHNRFMLHHNAINKLIKEVNQHERVMARYAERHLDSIDSVPMEDHASLRDKIETEKKLYLELKGEYYRFLTQPQ